MSKKLIWKLVLDLAMTILIVIAMGYDVSGGYLHEVIGIAISVLFLIHLLWNEKWIKQVLRNWKSPNMLVSKIKFGTDALLLILMIVMGISSVMISKFVFTANTNLWDMWYYLHTFAAYGMIAVLGVHIGFHWKMVMGLVKKQLSLKQSSKMRTVFVRILALLVVAIGIKSSFDREIAIKLIPEGLTATVAGMTDTLVVTMNAAPPSRGESDHGTVSSTFTDTPPEEGDSQEDYLGKLICTGCGKHCSLLSPRCNTGVQQAEEAIAYYEEYQTAQEQDEEDIDEIVQEEDDVIDEEEIVFMEKDSAASLFGDYVPILGMYAVCGHYLLVGVDASLRKRR